MTKSKQVGRAVGWVLAGLAGWAAVSSPAQALQVSRVSPQGEVAEVRQVRLQFDGAAVPEGQPQAPAPVSVSCQDPRAARGSGRWLSAREWVFDFDQDLPPGQACTVQSLPGYKSPQGGELAAPVNVRFNTGGPFVQNVFPSTDERIDEDQFFLLQLNGPATVASVLARVGCAVEGLGERVPVRLLDDAQRQALLKSRGLVRAAAADPLRYVALSCQRRLASSAQVELVVQPGLSTPGGLSSRQEKRFRFQVREAFSASFSCERENAQAACLPLRPLSLRFNAPVTRRVAESIRLEGGPTVLKPRLESEADSGEAQVTALRFEPPFPERTHYRLTLPAGLSDVSGRPLSNAATFPLAVATGPIPPLAKFAASPFGIVERLAEPGQPALLPLTLRRVEPALQLQTLSPGQVSDLQPRSDADIIAWQRKVQAFDAFWVARKTAQRLVSGPLPKPVQPEMAEQVESRSVSLLKGQTGAKALTLPAAAPGDSRPFEVVGVPLSPGFHVVEIASPQLGVALLAPGEGGARTMYVRTTALVTNLGVHFKLGRDSALAWVTTLDKGTVVAGAAVRVSDCQGREVAQGVTDAQGLVAFQQVPVQPPACASVAGPGGEDDYRQAYFISARARGADGVEDLAFTWSDWTRGIESWRFNVPTSRESRADLRAHTVLDRPLLRAGETVSMKHYLRLETRRGLALPPQGPAQLTVTHDGTGQQFQLPLSWRKTGSGGFSAESQFTVPGAAKLGRYSLSLDGRETGEFRVEAFRLPLLSGSISPLQAQALVNTTAVTAQLQVHYVAGGPAAQLPVRVSAALRPRAISFPDYEDYSFSPPRSRQAGAGLGGDEEDAQAVQDLRVVADKQALTLDRQGTGRLALPTLPRSEQAQDLLLEASYADPNGELNTLRSVSPLWPAAVIAGLKTEGWASSQQQLRFQALALDLRGQPQAGVALEVRAVSRQTRSSRKRMVGGFYSYDNQADTRDLGTVCSGRSDAQGLLLCETALKVSGEVELIVQAKDGQGQVAQAASSVWITQQGELWFGGDNHDRIDVLPEKRSYQPGEVARFQVRMPFRHATALVAVEREGVIHTEVVSLQGRDPTVSLKVQPDWGPNVYVSVLALRGRLREVPWYSLFTWGYKAPREWWTAFWYEGREYQAPSALVDLSKPAYRLGLAEIRVGTQAHRLDVKVSPDRASYPVRGKARVQISATLPDGRPAAGAEVALAVVDQALLELLPNRSWNLLDAMLQRRAWGVETATAQMEIIGRRHYGRKAVPAGGGGGRGATRELLDTLLLWNPRVTLNAQGQATVEVPLNDALSTFTIAAVADSGAALFGTGSASLRTTQDLQLISGLPPMVREDDQFRAQFTVRNTTAQAMKVQLSPRATLLTLAPQTVDVPPGEARELAWTVTTPAALALSRFESLLWELDARDTLSGARDALKVSQRVLPAVPLTVQQSSLTALDGPFKLSVQAPAGSLPGRGGVKLALQARLADGLPGVRDWWAAYPYVCLEQQSSRALGLRDVRRWQALLAQVPGYLDSDGLASYFPPRDGEVGRGSDVLSAYLLAASHEAMGLEPALALSEPLRSALQRGLTAFVEGRLSREGWSPRPDLDARKLAAMEALSRWGPVPARWLSSLSLTPQQWPTHSVIDWVLLLKRQPDWPQRQQRLAEAWQILQARLVYQGSRIGFNNESEDSGWWLMQNADVNSARLLLAVLDEPAWQDDLPRLAKGLLGRQQRGAWSTTTANFWGAVALDKFSARFERAPVQGQTRATLGAASGTVDWARVSRVPAGEAAPAGPRGSALGVPPAAEAWRHNSVLLPWPSEAGAAELQVNHQGSGKPWLTLQSLAAVPLKQAVNAGYQVRKTVQPLEQAVKGRYSRGDVLRISVELQATADMAWVVLSDPVPAGASILGSGLGRDSALATQGEKRGGAAWPAFEERSFEAFRSYYEFLPKGVTRLEYTVRLNNVGDFSLPPTRVEAMYAPEVFGEAPNARLQVQAAP
ncbi:MG2 domain-containing protein [Curvibacter sp. HBC61]|uniref:MG2 domain-containing protein n=1 Tax=Curvibacter cyanobacteriorum TaxID=3026422 RepID=A0ABT5MX89_9BURK|nr:MG2 domain-containing protein [Curvibacter sp. HBC61]MDD0838457.1 MG2 domain-containing protein [Curvibacter sp. HBC61]